jgi:hypothetical protein
MLCKDYGCRGSSGELWALVSKNASHKITLTLAMNLTGASSIERFSPESLVQFRVESLKLKQGH